MAVTPAYCRLMARYNAWQNGQFKAACERLTEAEMRAERGAFFGSIMQTLNHLLWGDMMWMSRFDGNSPPKGGIGESVDLCPTLAMWGVERFRTDQRMSLWAEKVSDTELSGTLTWFSGAANRDVTAPTAHCVVHMFNHQTHHRGQIHAMLTAAGQTIGDTDLVLMPETFSGEDKWH
ncbi:DinB family protein [Shimia abyssi]|uniref:Putative damage-inducible protein DinB n=1 Tax=Shimia abyssi TaxID=1662395 RepID=A0A2P8F6C0_9RHOB|nr:DinB family protein [Shimia abyssi]PSL17267.1 putative damage-inducible protein DinB [Shimia abyssi]